VIKIASQPNNDYNMNGHLEPDYGKLMDREAARKPTYCDGKPNLA